MACLTTDSARDLDQPSFRTGLDVVVPGDPQSCLRGFDYGAAHAKALKDGLRFPTPLLPDGLVAYTELNLCADVLIPNNETHQSLAQNPAQILFAFSYTDLRCARVMIQRCHPACSRSQGVPYA